MSPALRLRIPQPINSFKRSSTQSVRPTPQRLGPRTRPGLRRRVGADSRWGYNRWQIQLLLILGDSGKEVLGDSLRSIRSEVHTSELQSLMRISYAVVCLKKKKRHLVYIDAPTDNDGESGKGKEVVQR